MKECLLSVPRNYVIQIQGFMVWTWISLLKILLLILPLSYIKATNVANLTGLRKHKRKKREEKNKYVYY